MKKPYERPAIIHVENIEVSAAGCNKADDTNCPAPQVIAS